MNAWTTYPAIADPFPHVLQDNYLDADHYRALATSFPECPPNSGPTGHTLFWGDEAYDRLIGTSSAWSALFDRFHSQSFIDFSLSQFRSSLVGCPVDLTNAHYVPYQESRAEKELASPSLTRAPADAVWVRVDIMQGRVGYVRAPHLDHGRRAISMLIYMSDAEEDRMVGGELILNTPDGAPAKVIAPRHNRMVTFPCTPASFHSVRPILSQQGPRNFVQVTISSSVDLWDREPAPSRHPWSRVRGAVGRLREAAR
jgi:hypothetical protein